MVYYAFTIFLSAFLLFQVQPLISKRILPWFGGSPTVWTTCMLFFQVALLLGYLYAHVISTRLSLRRQVIVHGFVMAAALAFLPIYAGPSWKPDNPENPTWRIILLLSATVGLPYFVLATTSPLLQKWFTLAKPDAPVYRLYALSNVGSFLALLSYPSLIEPTLTGRWQATVWSAGFGLFVILCAYSAYLAWKTRPAEALPPAQTAAASGHDIERPGIFKRVMWLLLAACASTMLLAVTNQVCLDVAVVPFLWILPLALYLLSFVICFDSERWYYRPVFWPLMILMCGLMSWYLYKGSYAWLFTQIVVFSVGLFACCMTCHGELVRLKPHSRYLTSFYLMVSAGGALGGVFVALVAPRVFLGYTEIHVGIMASFAAASVAFLYHMWRRNREGQRQPLFVAGTLAAAGFLALSVWLIQLAALSTEGYITICRNFYGVLRIQERYPLIPERHRYAEVHGRTSHGWQFTTPALREFPTSYFGPQSGVGLLLRNFPRRSGVRVGVLGLGAGTLAAYAKKGDDYTFYEIDPNVEKLSRKPFTYLQDCKGKHEVVMGDGRLSLERELKEGGAGKFDVLILDAFSGDAPPVHLLTLEAFTTYLELLKPDGVIAVNVSNRCVDLHPVVWGLADARKLVTASVFSFRYPDLSFRDADLINQDADWMLVARNDKVLALPAIADAVNIAEDRSRGTLWTDDFSNLFRLIRWRGMQSNVTKGALKTNRSATTEPRGDPT